MTEPQFHPLADAFPLLDGKEFMALADDIAEHGLRESIKLLDDMILDGRNRYLACKSAGVEPSFEVFEGDDPVAYVISANLRRRHMDESQRSVVGAKLATIRVGDNQHKTAEGSPIGEAITQAKAAELLNVGKRSVERAREVIEKGAPSLIAAVEQGRVSVSAAATIASLPVEEQQAIVADGPTAVREAARTIREDASAGTAPVEVEVPFKDEEDDVDERDFLADSEIEDTFYNIRHSVNRMSDRSIYALGKMLAAFVGSRRREVARWIWQYRQGATLAYRVADECGEVVEEPAETTAGIEAVMSEFKDLGEHMDAVQDAREIGALSVTAFAHWAISQKAVPAKVDDFFGQLMHGHNLSPDSGGNAIKSARDKMSYGKLDGNPNRRAEYIFRAWNRYCGGGKVLKTAGPLPELECGQSDMAEAA